MRRFALSTGVYSIWTLVFCVAWLLGLVDVSGAGFALFVAGVILTVAAWHQVFASGLNLRFSDTALTEPQTMTGLAWVMVMMYLAGPLRDLAIPAVLITMLFGVFALDRRGFLRLAAFALAGHIAVSAALWWRAPGAVVPAVEVLREVDSVGRPRAFGRCGGEEFLIILPDCDAEGARTCAERVRRALAANELGNGCRLTVPAGVAEGDSALRLSLAPVFEFSGRFRRG